MSRMLTLAALSAAFLLALGGVAFADADVTIGDDGLNPESVKVEIKEPIVWTNATDEDVSLVGKDPKWESGPIAPGDTFSIHVTQAGTFAYESADGSLSGEIVVAAAKGGNKGNGGNEGGRDDDEEEVVDPKMPETGINAVVPGALSVLLIGFGGGLLRLTPRRR